MQRFASIVVLNTLLACAVAPPALAQWVQHGGSSDGTLVVLREIGAVVGPRDGSEDLEIVAMLPDAPSGAEDGVERGDLLLMAAGKRVRELDALKAAYEGTAVGDTLKLGFRRGDRRFLVSLEKAAAPEGQVRMVRMAGPGGGGDMQPLLEFGAILTESEGRVVVGTLIPGQETELAEGDVVTSVNGVAVDSLAAFREVYDAVPVGDDVSLLFARDGAEQGVTRARADSANMIRMRGGH